MDDLTIGLKNPAVIDFKIGKITYDPEATPEKIVLERGKRHTERMGFQILGMRVSYISILKLYNLFVQWDLDNQCT